MARRGRPRHPEILTPREWEVLALLRDGLSNEKIAERLDITVRTARYHVSEILSKLGVASREEAASWQPEERRSWWAGVFAPLVLAKRIKLAWIGMAGMAAVVVVGVAVLAWGLAKADMIRGGDGSSVHAVGTATPNAVPILSEEKAREIALREADLKGMPERDSLVISLTSGGAEPSNPVWSASVNGRFFPSSAQPQPVITEYRRIEIVIDGLDASVLSVELVDPVYITPLPLSLAPDGQGQPRPTFTPMPVPPGATLLTEAEIRARFESNPDIDQETLWLDLRTAGDISPSVGPLAPDYPIWIVRAEGTFNPRGGPHNSSIHIYHRMTTFIDAVTGMTIGYSLSGAED